MLDIENETASLTTLHNILVVEHLDKEPLYYIYDLNQYMEKIIPRSYYIINIFIGGISHETHTPATPNNQGKYSYSYLYEGKVYGSSYPTEDYKLIQLQTDMLASQYLNALLIQFINTESMLLFKTMLPPVYTANSFDLSYVNDPRWIQSCKTRVHKKLTF